MKTFYAVLVNSLIASVTNNFVWFAITFWVYLETHSVIATSIMAGVFTLTIAFSGFFLGSLVDRYKKKWVMAASSVFSLVFYTIAVIIYASSPPEVFKNAASPILWVFVVLSLLGALVGNLRGIALSTLVTIMVPEEGRDKANGMVGTANGVGFLVASILSGLAVGFIGITGMYISAIVVTALSILHLFFIPIPELKVVPTEAEKEAGMVDIPGTIRVINLVPGLFALIFFHTFNNFLGGVFMSLMDAYGLQLVSVQVWGTLWGFLSLGFIVGGMAVAKWGLGKNPLRNLFLANIVMWIICSFFTLQPSILLLTIGMFVWLCLIPVVEAAEQTVLQKVIPPERQGRVFGFAQSVEQAASPVTAFVIGPIAQLIFIPFMTTGAGVDLIGPWFGTGENRALALLFTLSGIIGLVVTLIAMRTRSYKLMSAIYE
jgi:DHA3 family multidrug efflux protein-like MFS transporter